MNNYGLDLKLNQRLFNIKLCMDHRNKIVPDPVVTVVKDLISKK